MLTMIEWVSSSDELGEDENFSCDAFYVVDSNGIVAGPFDDEGEAAWWEDKAKRV